MEKPETFTDESICTMLRESVVEDDGAAVAPFYASRDAVEVMLTKLRCMLTECSVVASGCKVVDIAKCARLSTLFMVGADPIIPKAILEVEFNLLNEGEVDRLMRMVQMHSVDTTMTVESCLGGFNCYTDTILDCSPDVLAMKVIQANELRTYMEAYKSRPETSSEAGGESYLFQIFIKICVQLTVNFVD